MAAALERNDNEPSNNERLDLKTIVLNDLDGGRGSELPRKHRGKHTVTLSAHHQNITSSKSSEYVSPRMYPYRKPTTYHGSLENLRAKYSSLNNTPATNKTPSDPPGIPAPEAPEDLEETYDYDDELDGQIHSLDEDDEDTSSEISGHSGFSRRTNDSNDTATTTSSTNKHQQHQGRLEPILENDDLNNDLNIDHDRDRRSILKYKIATGFAFEAMRRYKREVDSMQAQLQKKKEEVAARVILHNLLVNSWRLKSSDLNVYTQENSHLHKTV